MGEEQSAESSTARLESEKRGGRRWVRGHCAKCSYTTPWCLNPIGADVTLDRHERRCRGALTIK